MFFGKNVFLFWKLNSHKFFFSLYFGPFLGPSTELIKINIYKSLKTKKYRNTLIFIVKCNIIQFLTTVPTLILHISAHPIILKVQCPGVCIK